MKVSIANFLLLKFPLIIKTQFGQLKQNIYQKIKLLTLKRWLIKFFRRFDFNDKTHISAQYSRVSDSDYFKEIDRTNTDEKTLKSFIKLTYDDKDESLSLGLLTEDEQVVNAGVPVYTRALEASISKTFK